MRLCADRYVFQATLTTSITSLILCLRINLQLIGLTIGGWAMDRFGRRKTLLAALAIMTCMIFIVFFAVSLPMLAVGEIMCGRMWLKTLKISLKE
jgi:MFS family permease